MNELDETIFARFATRLSRFEALVPAPPPLSVDTHRPHRQVRVLRVAVLVGAVILLAAALGLAAIGSQPTPRRYTLASNPDAVVTCQGFAGPLPSRTSGDPCPSAIEAVQEATGSIGVRIVRITIRPGPFGGCGDYWSVGTPEPSCLRQPMIVPGTVMHAWVGFADTDRVLAVYLRRPVVPGTDIPYVSPSGSVFWDFTWEGGGWQIPPTGWVFP